MAQLTGLALSIGAGEGQDMLPWQEALGRHGEAEGRVPCGPLLAPLHHTFLPAVLTGERSLGGDVDLGGGHC